MKPAARKLTCRALQERYGVVDKTIGRWVQAGVLPPPMYINHRRYWDADEVDQCDHDRQQKQRTAPSLAPQIRNTAESAA
jgi:predicted site-specific integrase-resolvase